MASYEDITIDQGSDVAIQLHLVNPDGSKKDLTNHSVAAQMRRNYNSTEAVTFTCLVNSPAADGIVTMSLTNSQTNALKPRGQYVYDVELSFVDSDLNTIITRVLEGNIEVSPSVTQ